MFYLRKESRLLSVIFILLSHTTFSVKYNIPTKHMQMHMDSLMDAHPSLLFLSLPTQEAIILNFRLTFSS